MARVPFNQIAQQNTDISGFQRRRTVVLTSSNPSVPIPSWAQGGKGHVLISGTAGGGGGGGGAGDQAAYTGGGGGSSSSAHGFMAMIPAGVTTLDVTVGAGGTAGQHGSTANNNNTSGGTGGASIVSINSVQVLRLFGGNGGGLVTGAANGNGGTAGGFSWGPVGASTFTIANGTNIDLSIALRTPPSIRHGINGLAGTSTNSGTVSYNGVNGAGGITPFGAQGWGYGSGGNGGQNASGTAGQPGIIILEFVEGN